MGIPESENDQLTDTILCVEALSGFLGLNKSYFLL